MALTLAASAVVNSNSNVEPDVSADESTQGIDSPNSVPAAKVWEPNTPHLIELSVTVQYIGNIDVVKETFDGRLWIDVFWLPSQEELDSNGPPTEWDMESNLQTTNAIAVHAFDVKKQPQIKDVKGRTMYHAVVQVSATYSCPFDMHSFPFDAQKLYMILEMGNVKSMVYTPAAHIESVLSVETQLCVVSEWDFKDANISFTASDPALSKQGNRYSQCIVQLILPRVWQSFVQRYLLVIVLLTVSLLAVYSIDYEDVGDRLGFLFTLLLTSVAFAFIVSEKLPPTPYLTFFDEYYVASNLIVFINILTIALTPTVVEWGFEEFDTMMFLLTCAGMLATHVAFFILSFKARRKGIEKVSVVELSNDGPQNIKATKQYRSKYAGEDDDRFMTFRSSPPPEDSGFLGLGIGL